jgi:hypothetical protein
MRSPSSLNVLKIVLYGLAGIVLILGLITGISLMGAAANIHNTLMVLQMMGDAISNLIIPILRNLLNGLGIFTLLVSLLLSVLLYTAGRLIAINATLEARLARLEAQA